MELEVGGNFENEADSTGKYPFELNSKEPQSLKMFPKPGALNAGLKIIL